MKKTVFLLSIIGIILTLFKNSMIAQTFAYPVVLKINLAEESGLMSPVWAWFGYDEPNYTYMKDGKKLLSEISALSPVPVYVRAHNLLTSGDGTPSLKK